MSFQPTAERNAAIGPIFLQPWFWLSIVGVLGMVALTIFG